MGADSGDNSGRISVILAPAIRDAFFDFCRRLTPRRSMSQRLLEHIRADLGLPEGADGKPPPKRRTPRPKGRH